MVASLEVEADAPAGRAREVEVEEDEAGVRGALGVDAVDGGVEGEAVEGDVLSYNFV